MKLFAAPSYIVAAVIGVLLALLLAPVAGVLTDYGFDVYDRANPVATVAAVRVPSPPGEIRLTMKTTKHRQCELQRVFAFDRAPDGAQVRAKIEKLEPGEYETIPSGQTVQSLVWRVYPVTGTSITVYAEHACGDRIVRTQLFVMGTGNVEDQ